MEQQPPKGRAAVQNIFEIFAEQNPQPKTELNYFSTFTLLVAVVLSAQSTDVGVNRATAGLFAVADSPAKMVTLGLEGIVHHIRSLGLYNSKAAHVLELSAQLLSRHGGEVPSDRAALEALPGVGRKTANVVLNLAFGQPTLAVDTHIFRLAHRLGFSSATTPAGVEADLLGLIAQNHLHRAHHWLILHGRYICVARRPKCHHCLIAAYCPPLFQKSRPLMNRKSLPGEIRSGLNPAVFPLLFVLLWSTGFIGARLGLPYADPYSFLAIRLLAASLFMALVAWIAGAEWPRGRDLKHSLVSGLLIHLGYLGGVFTGVWMGCPPAVGALITGLQPLFTGLLAARILGERISLQVVVGLVLGLVGVMIVLSDHLSFRNYNHYSLIPIGVALLSITAGTVYQKRFFGLTDIRAGSAVQYLLCGILFAVPSLLSLLMPGLGIPSFQDIHWTGEFWIALLWLTLVLSVVSIALLFWLIRAYSASRVSSLMYLVPPTTALEAWLLFGDPISLRILLGMGVVILGLVWGERARRVNGQ